MSVDVPARQYRRNQFRRAIGINILQGLGSDLNGRSGAGFAASVFVELKADRFGLLGRLEGGRAVAAELYAKLENPAIRIFDRP